MDDSLMSVPWDRIEVGMRVLSGATNWTGVITELLPLDDCSIWIDWDNGRTSMVYHHQAWAIFPILEGQADS